MEDLMLNISVRDGNSGSRKKTPKVSKRLEKKSKRYQDKDPSLKKFNSFGTVKSLPSDWILYDVKKLSIFLKKVKGILDVKRIVLKKNQSTRVTITCFQNFRFGTELPQSLLKKGKNHSQLRLDMAKLGRPLKDKKKKSLKHLLAQEFGNEWEKEEDLQWYKTILENDGDNLDEEEDATEDECDCLEDDVGLHI